VDRLTEIAELDVVLGGLAFADLDDAAREAIEISSRPPRRR